ncbi:MAG: hypothetical protein ACC645_11880 [Pirellulales bacterium]
MDSSDQRELIEQAIFTSAQTKRGDGYQIVASSNGIADDDARALSTWCPSHDAMLDEQRASNSVNFHPLPSGAYCVSRTDAVGVEYSGRGGRRIHTHCLVVPPLVMRRFGNNPCALLQAAVAGGTLDTADCCPNQLNAIRLPGRARTVDRGLLTYLTRDLGAEAIGYLVHKAMTAHLLGLAAGRRTEKLIAGLVSCFPLECRTDFSFSTGLRYSPRRPFRWIAVDGDPSKRRQQQRQFGMAVIDPRQDHGDVGEEPLRPWAEFVQTCLRDRKLTELRNELEKSHPEVKACTLPEAGDGQADSPKPDDCSVLT